MAFNAKAVKLFIDNGSGPADYSKYVDYGTLEIVDALNQPTLINFNLTNIDNEFQVPERSAYVSLEATAGISGVLASGFVSQEPRKSYITDSAKHTQGAMLTYVCAVTSDEWLLNVHTLPFVPALVNRTMGQILRELAEDLVPGFYDFTHVDDGDLVPLFRFDPQKRWSQYAKEFADSIRFRYKVIDKKVFFKPYGDASIGVTYDEVGGSKGSFIPHSLQTEVFNVPIVNDVIVIGDEEPYKIREDHFIGDGITADFANRHKVFRGATALLLQEHWDRTEFRTNLWDVEDPDNRFVLAGLLNLLGGTGPVSLGTAYIKGVNGVELGGHLDIEHGEVEFTDAGSGIIGGIYNDSALDLASCEAGFYISGGNTIHPVVDGVIGDTLASITMSGYHYRFQTVIAAKKWTRYRKKYRTLSGTEFGGTDFASEADIAFLVHEIPLSDPENFVTYRLDTTPTLSAFGLYAVVNDIDLNAVLAFTQISQPIQAELSVRSLVGPTGGQLPIMEVDLEDEKLHPLGFGLQKSVGTLADTQDYTTLRFYEDSVPAVGSRIRLRSWETGRSIARVRDSASVMSEAKISGDDGVRAAIVSDLEPAPRTSEDCDDAAAAFITDRKDTQYNGSYTFIDDFLDDGEDYPRTGRFFTINSPMRGLDSATFLVRRVKIAVAKMSEAKLIFQIEFGPDLFLNKLLPRFLKPREAILSPQDIAEDPVIQAIADVGTVFLDDLNNAKITDIDGTTITIDLGESLGAGEQVEVRRVDSGWTQNDQHRLSVQTTQTFTMSRAARDQTWYLRRVNTAGTKYSRRTTALRVEYPLVPEAPTGELDTRDWLKPKIKLDLTGDIRDIYGIEIRTCVEDTEAVPTGATNAFNLPIELNYSKLTIDHTGTAGDGSHTVADGQLWTHTKFAYVPADYPEINEAFFEVVAKTINAVAHSYRIWLVDDDLTVYSYVELDSTAGNYKRYKSSAFALPSSSKNLYIVSEAPTAADIGDIEWWTSRLMLHMIDTGRAKIQIPMLAGDDGTGGGNQDATQNDEAAYIKFESEATLGSTYQEFSSNPADAYIFLKDESALVTLEEWELAVTARVQDNEAEGDAVLTVGLFNKTTGLLVDTAEVSFTGQSAGAVNESVVTTKSVTFSNTATNFDDLNEFEIQVKLAGAGGGDVDVYIYKVDLFAVLTLPTRIQIYNKVAVDSTLGIAAASGGYGVEARWELDSDRYAPGSLASFESTAAEALSGASMYLRDMGTVDQDGEASSSNVSGSQLDFTTDTRGQRSRSDEISLTDGNRYVGYADNQSASEYILRHSHAFVIIDTTGSENVEADIEAPIEILDLGLEADTIDTVDYDEVATNLDYETPKKTFTRSEFLFDPQLYAPGTSFFFEAVVTNGSFTEHRKICIEKQQRGRATAAPTVVQVLTVPPQVYRKRIRFSDPFTGYEYDPSTPVTQSTLSLFGLTGTQLTEDAYRVVLQTSAPHTPVYVQQIELQQLAAALENILGYPPVGLSAEMLFQVHVLRLVAVAPGSRKTVIEIPLSADNVIREPDITQAMTTPTEPSWSFSSKNDDHDGYSDSTSSTSYVEIATSSIWKYTADEWDTIAECRLDATLNAPAVSGSCFLGLYDRDDGVIVAEAEFDCADFDTTEVATVSTTFAPSGALVDGHEYDVRLRTTAEAGQDARFYKARLRMVLDPLKKSNIYWRYSKGSPNIFGGGEALTAGSGTPAIETQIEMATIDYMAVNSEDRQFIRSQRYLNTDDYDQATYYFGGVFANKDGSDREVRLIDSTDTVLATITVPSSIGTAFTLLDLVEFTPNDGADVYRVEMEQSTTTGAVRAIPKIFIRQATGWTKTRISRVMFNGHMGERSSEQFTTGTGPGGGNQPEINNTTSASYVDSGQDGMSSGQYILDTTRWSDRATAYRFETLHAWTGLLGTGSFVRLYNNTDDATVIEHGPVGSGVPEGEPVHEVTEFDDTQANWDVGDGFHAQFKKSGTFTGSKIYLAMIHIVIKNFQGGDSIEIPYQMSRWNSLAADGYSGEGAPDNEDRSEKFRFTLPDLTGVTAAYYEAVLNEQSSGTHVAFIKDVGSSVTGSTGTDITGAEITHNSSTFTMVRSGDFLSELTGGNNIIPWCTESSGDLRINGGSWLILRIETSSGPTNTGEHRIRYNTSTVGPITGVSVEAVGATGAEVTMVDEELFDGPATAYPGWWGYIGDTIPAQQDVTDSYYAPSIAALRQKIADGEALLGDCHQTRMEIIYACWQFEVFAYYYYDNRAQKALAEKRSLRDTLLSEVDAYELQVMAAERNYVAATKIDTFASAKDLVQVDLASEEVLTTGNRYIPSVATSGIIQALLVFKVTAAAASDSTAFVAGQVIGGTTIQALPAAGEVLDRVVFKAPSDLDWIFDNNLYRVRTLCFDVYFFNLLWEYSEALRVSTYLPPPDPPIIEVASVMSIDIQIRLDVISVEDTVSVTVEMAANSEFVGNVVRVKGGPLQSVYSLHIPGGTGSGAPIRAQYIRARRTDYLGHSDWSDTLFISEEAIKTGSFLTQSGNTGAVSDPLNNLFTYDSTTTEIVWSWTQFTVTYSDGFVQTVPAGTVTHSGLTADTTYKFYPYLDGVKRATGIAKVPISTVNGGEDDDPTLAALASADGHLPLSRDVMEASTPAAGNGSGSGGGIG